MTTQVAAAGLALIVVLAVKNHFYGTKAQRERQANTTFLSTYAISYVTVLLAAKYATTRLGTPTEAFVNFAVSGVLGFIAMYATDV